MTFSLRPALLVALVACACSPAVVVDEEGPTGDWPFWGGDQGASHYAALDTMVT